MFMNMSPGTTTGSMHMNMLLNAARGGELRIPPFQRPFVWETTDILLLLDSIRRGFPIGTMILWAHETATNGTVTIGPLTAQASGWARWVLDGQQRLTALVLALTTTEYVYNVERDVFTLAPAELTRWDLPVATMFGAYMKWMRGAAGKEPTAGEEVLLERSDEVVDAFREAQIATITIDGPESFARDVFRRFNTSGRPFGEADVFAALTAATLTAKV